MKIAQCTCGAKFDVSTYAPGAKLKCAKCKSIFTVPEDAAEDSPAPMPVEAATQATGAAKGGGSAASSRAASSSAATVAGGGTGKTTRVTRNTRTATRSRPGSGGTKAVGSRSSGSYKPAAKSSNLVLTLGSGAVALILVVVLVIVLGKNGDGGKKGGAGGGTDGSGSASDAAAKSTRQKILDKIQPHSARDWLTVADTEKDMGLAQDYEKDLETAVQMDPKNEEIVNRFKSLLQSKIAALNTHDPDYADHVYDFADKADKLGLKSVAEDICYKIVGDRVKVIGIDPKHAKANKYLGNKLDPYGEWQPADFVDAIAQKIKDSAKEREEVAKLDPWHKAAYDIKKGMPSPENWTFVAAPPYLIIVQNSQGYAPDIEGDTFRECAQHLYKVFKAEYADKFKISAIFEGPEANAVLPILVYESRETYLKETGAPPYAGGHFEPSTGWIKMYHSASGGKPYETVFHEGTHQLVGKATKLMGAADTNMFWFTEGIATFFEDFKRDPRTQEFILGVKSPQYLPRTQLAIQQKKYVPFKDILGETYMQFRIKSSQMDPFHQQDYVGLHYSESWSIVYFFYKYENGKYKDKFDKYFEEEIHGHGSLAKFKEIVGDPEQIEKEWLEFTKNLKLEN